MKPLYGIAAAGERVRLDSRRCGEVRFTIANHAGQPLLTRLRVVALDGAGDGWFAPPEVAERMLDVDATETVVVTVAVPGEVSAGTYGVRLDLIGVDNPDEYFTAGPRVQVLVPAPPPPPPPLPAWPWFAASAVLAVAGGLLALSTHRPWWLAILLPLAAVAAAVGTVMALTRRRPAPAPGSPPPPPPPPPPQRGEPPPPPSASPKPAALMPRLIGLSVEEATAALAAVGAAVGTVVEEASAAKPRTVLDQRPAAEQELPPGGRVKLVVAVPPPADPAR